MANKRSVAVRKPQDVKWMLLDVLPMVTDEDEILEGLAARMTRPFEPSSKLPDHFVFSFDKPTSGPYVRLGGIYVLAMIRPQLISTISVSMWFAEWDHPTTLSADQSTVYQMKILQMLLGGQTSRRSIGAVFEEHPLLQHFVRYYDQPNPEKTGLYCMAKINLPVLYLINKEA